MAAFDELLKLVRQMLPALDDQRMTATWCGESGGKTLLSMPRAVMIRAILMNHIYHHRGQLGVYLRLLGAKVPAAYEPSGDEAPASAAS